MSPLQSRRPRVSSFPEPHTAEVRRIHPSETVRKVWIGTESVLYQAQQMARQGSISAPRASEDPRYSVIASIRKDANHLRKSSPVKHFKAAR